MLRSILVLILIIKVVNCYVDSQDFIKELDLSSPKFHFKQHFIGKHLHLTNSTTPKVLFSCRNLFTTSLETKSVLWPPPTNPPQEYLNAFSFDDTVPIVHEYYMEKQNGGTGYFWKKEDIDKEKINGDCDCGQYSKLHCDIAMKKYIDYIKGKKGYVFGTQKPWAESALLYRGASYIKTVEYMKIETDHPKLSGIHPSDIAKEYLSSSNHSNLLYDFAWSFSSFEHDGLGRYGDPINPYADLESIARVHCLLKPGGVLFLGLPVAADAVHWNAHRFYGKLRLYLIFSMHWELIDVIGAEYGVQHRSADYTHQPIFVMKKLGH